MKEPLTYLELNGVGVSTISCDSFMMAFSGVALYFIIMVFISWNKSIKVYNTPVSWFPCRTDLIVSIDLHVKVHLNIYLMELDTLQ
jgi:hypothetical protein